MLLAKKLTFLTFFDIDKPCKKGSKLNTFQKFKNKIRDMIGT